MVAEIAIIVPMDDVDEVRSTLAQGGINAVKGSGHGFDGSDVVSLTMHLSPVVAGLLASLYATRQKAKRFTKFRYKGIELEGVSEAKLTELAERAMKDAVKKR